VAFAAAGVTGRLAIGVPAQSFVLTMRRLRRRHELNSSTFHQQFRYCTCGSDISWSVPATAGSRQRLDSFSVRVPGIGRGLSHEAARRVPWPRPQQAGGTGE